MQFHHLELTTLSRRGTRAPRVLASPSAGLGREFARLIAGLIIGVIPCLSYGPAEATFTSAPATRTFSAAGGSFNLAVTPVPSAVRRGPNVHLTWTAVTVSSGDTVHYRVMRTSPGLAAVQTCTGADTPVTSGGIVTCIDRKPGATSSYTVQAYVVSSTAVETWSLPASPSVSA